LKKILIIDDEKDLVELVSFRLQAAGYDVSVAYDGLEGFEKAKSEEPDLIILFTAKVQPADKQLGADVGADAYVTKPFEPQDLLDKVKELLKQKR
jgi:DNA-binding response OmpR family regulator